MEENEAETGNTRRMKKQVGEKKKKKMTVEEYFDFFKSCNTHSKSITFLNQIIHMHGFQNLHRSKTVINHREESAFLNLEFLHPSIEFLSSSSATLTLEEVSFDIEALKWRECSVTSLQILSAGEKTQTIAKPKRSETKKRKRISMKKLLKSSKGSCDNGTPKNEEDEEEC